MSAGDESHNTIPNLNLGYFVLASTERMEQVSLKDNAPCREPRRMSRGEFEGLNGHLDTAAGTASIEGETYRIEGVVYQARVAGAHRARVLDFREYLNKKKPESLPAF